MREGLGSGSGEEQRERDWKIESSSTKVSSKTKKEGKIKSNRKMLTPAHPFTAAGSTGRPLGAGGSGLSCCHHLGCLLPEAVLGASRRHNKDSQSQLEA